MSKTKGIQTLKIKVQDSKSRILFQNETNIYALSLSQNFKSCARVDAACQLRLHKLNVNTHHWDKICQYKVYKSESIRKKSFKLLLPLIFNKGKPEQMRTISIEDSITSSIKLYIYHTYQCHICYRDHSLPVPIHQLLACLSIDTSKHKKMEIERLDSDLEKVLKGQNYALLSYTFVGFKQINNQCNLWLLLNGGFANECVVHLLHDKTNKFQMVKRVSNFNFEAQNFFISNNNTNLYHLEANQNELKICKYDEYKNASQISLKHRLKFECCIMIKGNYCVMFAVDAIYLLNMKTLILSPCKSSFSNPDKHLYDYLYDSIRVIVKRNSVCEEMFIMAGFIRCLMRQNLISMYRYPPNYLIRLMTTYYCDEEIYLMRMSNLDRTDYYVWKFNVDNLFFLD